MRAMIDTTHSGLATALPFIKQLTKGSLVAGYDTGSPDIVWTSADRSEIPADLVQVFIDQDFTGSPQPSATIIDCEKGAWSPGDIDKRMSIATCARPTLYAAPGTLIAVADSEKWRGDVWVVLDAATEPTSPPAVPKGFNVIGQQWFFGNSAFDGSVIFDDTWPDRKMAMPGTPEPPPGQWLNAKDWTWQQVVITGRGLNNQLYSFAYDEQTGKWNSVPV